MICDYPVETATIREKEMVGQARLADCVPLTPLSCYIRCVSGPKHEPANAGTYLWLMLSFFICPSPSLYRPTNLFSKNDLNRK